MVTKSELWDQLAKTAKVYDQFGVFGTNTYLPLEGNIIEATEGIHSSELLQEISRVRAQLNQTFSAGRNALLVILRELAAIGYESVATNESEILDDIVVGMVTASETVKNRAWTFGSLQVGLMNIGNAVVYRCTKDKYNFDIEAGIPGNIKVLVKTDKNSGAQAGNEAVVFQGLGTRPKDEIEYGNITSETLTAQIFRADNGLLRNPSFDAIESTITTTTQQGWTLSAINVFAKETAIFFRTSSGGTTGASLKFLDNGTLMQYLGTQRITVPRNGLPAFLILRYRKTGGCDGTMTLRLGTQTVSVDLTTVTSDTWLDLTIGVGASNKGYPESFNEDFGGQGTRVEISLTGRTIGNLYVDEVLLKQSFKFNGLFYLPVAGNIDVLASDYWTFADSALETGRIQYILSRLFKWHFPHTSGSPTYPDA